MKIHRIRVYQPRFVVVVQEQGHDETDHSRAIPLYLEAIAYQATPRTVPYRSLAVDLEDAFVFRERAAAELAAVWCGGEVRLHSDEASKRPSATG